MEITEVPTLRFASLRYPKATYRILTEDDSTRAACSSLRTWKPPKNAYGKSHRAIEEDEPIAVVCGVENPFAGIFEDDESDERDEEEMSYRSGIWSCEQEFSHHFHKAAFGKGLSKLPSLEGEYGCTVTIHELDRLRITSTSKENLTKFLMYLSEKSSSTKLKYTHFICLPLINSVEVASSLEALVSQVSDPRMKSAFVSPRKLHFTLAMLNLNTEADISKVKSVLQAYSGYCENIPITVDLKGVTAMDNAKLESLKVAYTGALGGDSPDGWKKRIAEIAKGIGAKLSGMGYLDLNKQRSYYDGINGKLHATILNSKYAARLVPGELSSSDSEHDARKEWNPLAGAPDRKKGLDGREFIRQFKDFYFGQVHVNEIRLCSLIETPGIGKDPDGFYQTLLSVRL
jgi:2'-5' RNA ligase